MQESSYTTSENTLTGLRQDGAGALTSPTSEHTLTAKLQFLESTIKSYEMLLESLTLKTEPFSVRELTEQSEKMGDPSRRLQPLSPIAERVEAYAFHIMRLNGDLSKLMREIEG